MLKSEYDKREQRFVLGNQWLRFRTNWEWAKPRLHAWKKARLNDETNATAAINT